MTKKIMDSRLHFDRLHSRFVKIPEVKVTLKCLLCFDFVVAGDKCLTNIKIILPY